MDPVMDYRPQSHRRWWRRSFDISPPVLVRFLSARPHPAPCSRRIVQREGTLGLLGASQDRSPWIIVYSAIVIEIKRYQHPSQMTPGPKSAHSSSPVCLRWFAPPSTSSTSSAPQTTCVSPAELKQHTFAKRKYQKQNHGTLLGHINDCCLCIL